MTQFSITLEHDREIRKALNRLGEKQVGVIRRAARRVTKPTVDAIARAAPVRPGSGALQDAIKVVTRSSKSKGTVSLLIGVDPKAEEPDPENDPGFRMRGGRPVPVPAEWNEGRTVRPLRYFHLVELGTTTLPAQPFFKPTWRRREPAIVAAFEAELVRSVAEEFRKRNRRRRR